MKADHLTPLRGRVLRAMSNNLMSKLLSLIFAVFIWAWVQTEQVIDKRARARVVYVWPEGLVRTQEVPKTLVVTLRGPQGLVRNLDSGHLRYKVDLAERELGHVSVDFSAKNLAGLPDGVTVVQVSPPAVDIELDRELEREVKVKETVIGDVAAGFRKGKVTVSPSTIQITGPQSLVRQISEMATDVVDINGLTETTSFDIAMAIKERTVSIADNQSVTVTVEVSPIIVKKTFNDVPVMTRGKGWKPRDDTAVVTLEGNAADMLELSPEQVSVQVHLPEEVPPGKTLQIQFDRNAPRSGLEVVHQGPDSVGVVNVQPTTVILEREQ